MAPLVTPIHIGNLNGLPLRFFRAPFKEPHLPWHAPDDLHACLAFPPLLRKDFQQRLQSTEWAKDVRPVATTMGIVTIAPHWMAQGLLGSVIQLGLAQPSIELDYAVQAGDAINVLTGHLPDEAAFHLMCTAFRNTNRMGTSGGAA